MEDDAKICKSSEKGMVTRLLRTYFDQVAVRRERCEPVTMKYNECPAEGSGDGLKLGGEQRRVGRDCRPDIFCRMVKVPHPCTST